MGTFSGVPFRRVLVLSEQYERPKKGPKIFFSQNFSCAYFIYKLNEMVYEYIKYATPQASNIEYFRNFSPHHDRVSCVAKLFILTLRKYAQKMSGCGTV